MAVQESSASGGQSCPSRALPLSNFDSRRLRECWKDEEEKASAEGVLSTIATAFGTIIDNLGDPRPDRDGLTRTPVRAAKALCYFTKGYEEDLASTCVVTRDLLLITLLYICMHAYLHNKYLVMVL